ncbi:hypothetical protein ACEWY4_006753 [Coilia grayii]|uniref:Doublecortin domain-containing protein n=1 Tax=Coilia grayii TaxID=363190 RepID=A0ABD1KEX4_9TELE
MSVTPHPDLLQAGVSPGSVQTVSSRPRPPPSSNPMASKRVCFYKSGDPQFGVLRMVINGRTFKTLDALLDALSKKVPLPFGVRTITTPRGTNSIRALEELQDGGSYVCSDQKRVKPLNLEQANRRQVPWNATRPISAWRRGNQRPIPRGSDVGIRPGRMIDRTIAVRTPRRLVVYKNRDPTVKRIVVLQRRIAPTFDALLDYLSQVMQFPVVKLFTPDGRRVEGLAGLILCSGVVVAAGTEHFRLSNFSFQGGAPHPTQSAFPMEHIRAPTQIYKKKSLTSSTRSRKFSLSSERYFVNQIRKSLSESLSEHESHHSGSLGTDINRPSESVDMEPCECMTGVNMRDCPAMPTEDDIEKSFRVNQDGSMTVEMKVRLTLKQEEMIHWTTTLSRTSVSRQSMGACTLHPVSGPNSPDASNDSSRNARGHSKERASKGSRCRNSTERTVAFKEQVGHYCTSAKAETSRSLRHSRRSPTPGPRHLKSHSTSVENVTTVTETEVQESTVGTYSYMEHTSEGDVTEGYCVVSRNSTSSIRPVPKPRKTGSAEGKKSTLHPTETAKHICETQQQGSYDDCLASPQYSLQKRSSQSSSPQAQSKPSYTDSGPCSSNNDCDVDLTRRSTASESLNGKKDEIFSLSSGSVPPQQQSKTKLTTGSGEITANKYSSAHKSSYANEDTRNKSGGMKKRTITSRTQKKAFPLPSRSDKRQRNITADSSKTRKRTSSSDNVAKTMSSSESAQNKKIGRVKKSEKNNRTSASKSTISALSAEQGLNLDEGTVGDLSHNLNDTNSETPKKPFRKNVQDILTSLPPGHNKKTILKQKSMNDEQVKSPKQSRELSESNSMPLLCSTPPIQQYVETWLQQVQPGRVPYMEELHLTETEKDTVSAGNDLSKGSEEKSISEIPCEKEGRLTAEDLSVDSLEQHQPLQVQCEGGLLDNEPQGTRAFCKSMPSVRIHSADQDCKTRMHKSTEALFPLESEPPNDVKPNYLTGGMQPILQQLCLSLQSIRKAASPMPPTLEKTHSLPDFSVQVASVFGAPSSKLLSFLSVMALKDGSGSQGSQLSLKGDRNSCPEALKVMQSLEKLANTEDEQELKACLSDLHNSISPRFQESWREFQENLPNSEQEGVDSTHENESPTNDLHSLPTDEQCNIEEVLTGNDTERQEQTTSGYQQNGNCTVVLLSQSEEGNIIPHDTESSQEPQESVAQTEKAASSAEHKHSAPMQKHSTTNSLQVLDNVNSAETLGVSGSERKSLRSEESAKGQKINKSSQSVKTKKSERKGSRSQPLIKSTTSPNPGIRKSLSSTKALQLGVATPRNSSSKAHNANAQSSLPAARKPETPINSGQTKKITTAKPKSVNGDRLKPPKQDLCESVSVPFICAPPADVNQYVGSWLEKMQPEPVICAEGMNHPEAEPQKRAVFRIGPETSEESEVMSTSGYLSPEEKGLSFEENAHKVQQPTPLIQIKCERELADDKSQRLRGFCRSMPSVRVQPGDQDCHTKMHNSTEALFPLESEPPSDVAPNCTEDMQPILQQLCLSLQSIRKAASPMPPALEKTHSLPDFSGQVASVFGASSTKLLSFLSITALKDVSTNQASQLLLKSERSSCPEALKVMQSLEKLVNTEDEQELKACLADLCNSTSPKLQDSWKEFQEKYDIQNCLLASPKKMVQEFALDAYSESGDQNKDSPCGIEQLMDELSMCEELRQEISSLVEEEMSCHDAASLPISTAEEALHIEHADTYAVVRTGDVEGSEAAEVMAVALPEDTKKANCMNESHLEEINSFQTKSAETNNSVEEQDEHTEKANSMHESHLEEVNSVQTKSVETINSVDEGVRSVAGSNEAESFKCEETGSRIAESEDIDRERFLTPVTESEVKDIDNCSESWKGYDTVHRSEEAQCECSDEDIAGGKKVTNRDSPVGEKDGHMQENKSHNEPAGNLRQALSCVEAKEDSLKGSNSYQGLCTHSENAVCPNKMEGMQPDTQPNGETSQPVEFSRDLLDFINKALLSSSLAFTYDCDGNLRVLPEIGEGKCVRASTSADSQYGLKRLPSPCTSDLSDYRPDTADSEACKSQGSFDIATDASIGDEEADKVSRGSQGKDDQDCANSYSKNSAFSAAENGTATFPSAEKSHVTPKSDLESVCSLKSNQDTPSRASHQDIAYFSTSSSMTGDSESGQCLSFSQTDLSEGVLIDKGRWLLKENHLIRTSPPVAMGMYGQLDSSSADSGQDHTSEEAPPAQHLNHHSALTVFSSSELEEMARPPTPKCTYFTIPHSSDSDPFQDDQSSNGSKQEDILRGNRVSPQEEPPTTWARKNSSFPSFASVEFKLPDGKIHPEGEATVERPARSQTIGGRTLQEEDSTESLQLRCGQNCPIL